MSLLHATATSSGAGASTACLTVTTSRAESFEILDSSTKLRWLFPSTHDEEHQVSATIHGISTTFTVKGEKYGASGQPNLVTVEATAAPPAKEPDWTLHVPDQDGWRRIRSRGIYVIPQHHGPDATFAVARSHAEPSQQPLRESSSAQMDEASKRKKRKRQKKREKKAPAYTEKQIQPIYDAESVEAYLKRHIKKEHPRQPNGHDGFEVLLRAMDLGITAMELRLELLSLMTSQRPTIRKLLAGLTDSQYSALKGRLIPKGRKPKQIQEILAERHKPEHHLSHDLFPIVAHRYQVIIVCLSRRNGSRSSWSYLPEGIKDRREDIQVAHFPVVGLIFTAGDDPRDNRFDSVELDPEAPLPPVSVWRWGDRKKLAAIARGPVHVRCHESYWFESRGTWKKPGTAECICKYPASRDPSKGRLGVERVACWGQEETYESSEESEEEDEAIDAAPTPSASQVDAPVSGRMTRGRAAAIAGG